MSTNDSYFLARNATESKRLDIQHGIYTRSLGYHIHPSISKNFPSSPCIADIAAGTGIYLHEVASQLPETARLDAFDISKAQFASDLPQNISFYTQDAKQAFPKDFHGVYDFVHISLLVTALDKDEWEVVLSNVTQLLKPGGAIQWAEPNLSVSFIGRGQSSLVQPATMRELSKHFMAAMKHRLDNGYWQLPGLMTKVGLQNVFEDIVASDRLVEDRPSFTSICFLGVFGWARTITSRSVPDWWKLDDVDALEKEVEKEIAAGCYVRYDLHVIIGFRGLD